MLYMTRAKLLALGMGLSLLISTVACASTSSLVTTARVDETQAQTTPETATEETATEETATEATTATETVERPTGWREDSHSNDAAPNYDVVFPKDKVNEILITISPENWAAMQADMTELFGEPGTRGRGPGGGQGGAQPMPPMPMADDSTLLTDTMSGTATTVLTEGVPTGFQRPAGNAGFGGDMTTENPIWVTATIEFEGEIWTNVGVRYKGNSSLSGSWNNKSLKLPFKLDFDEFEKAYPEIDNQRFYGFKQLSLGNSFGDATYMRDAIAYDLFEDAGLVAAETAFYEVTVDYGEGPVNLGIYTVIEVIDDTVVDRAFDGDSGNIYEADGRAASLADGTFAQIEESFQKENNEDTSDWRDLQALYNVLHSAERTTNPEAWRAELESIFAVDTFLEWLAISAAIQHWDTYGGMTHNYYLYHDPATDQLTWISWDHNFVLGGTGSGMGDMAGGRPQPDATAENAPENSTEGVQPPNANLQNPADAGRMGGGRGGPNRSTSLDKADVSEAWPLIRYLLDDPTYYASYINYLEETSKEVFNADALAEQYAQWAAMLAPYTADANSEAAFETAVQELLDRTYERAEAVELFLNEQK